MEAAMLDAMATKKKTEAEDLPRQIGVRLSDADFAKLESLATHLPGSTLARLAIRIGLQVIQEQPGVLLGEKPKRR
jgi:hypothetical protein